MNKNIKRLLLGLLCGILTISLAVSVFAAPIERTLTAIYSNIKIIINGEGIIPKDADGNIVEPFVVNGTTYLPLRAVAEALGMNVEWDSATNTIKITNAVSDTGEDWREREGEEVTVNGLKYLLFAEYNTAALIGKEDGNTLTALTIPSTIEVAGVPYTVKFVGDDAFREAGLTSVTLANTLIAIGDNAFRLNQIAGSVVIPNTVTELGDASEHYRNIMGRLA